MGKYSRREGTCQYCFNQQWCYLWIHWNGLISIFFIIFGERQYLSKRANLQQMIHGRNRHLWCNTQSYFKTYSLSKGQCFFLPYLDPLFPLKCVVRKNHKVLCSHLTWTQHHGGPCLQPNIQPFPALIEIYCCFFSFTLWEGGSLNVGLKWVQTTQMTIHK